MYLPPPVESPPTTLPRQTQPEAHIGRSSCTPNFCSRDHALGANQSACSVREVLHGSRGVAAEAAWSSNDLHRYGLDLHRTTSPTASREVGALLDAAAEAPSGIVLSVDEIDSDKTDTFGPFCSAQPPEETTTLSHEFLSQITFEGSEDLQRRCRLLCIEFAKNEYKLNRFHDTITVYSKTVKQIFNTEVSQKTLYRERPVCTEKGENFFRFFCYYNLQLSSLL